LKVADGSKADEPEAKTVKIDLDTRKKEVGKALAGLMAELDGADDAVIKVTGLSTLANLASFSTTPYTSKTGVARLPQGAFGNELYQATKSMMGEAFDKDIYKALLNLLVDQGRLFLVRAGKSRQYSFFAPVDAPRTSEIAIAAKAYLLSLTAN
jgi:hypothetical protein